MEMVWIFPDPIFVRAAEQECDLHAARRSRYSHLVEAAALADQTLVGIDGRFKRSIRIDTDSDVIVGGKRLVLSFHDEQKKLDFESRLTLLSDRAGIVFELLVTNASAADLIFSASSP